MYLQNRGLLGPLLPIVSQVGSGLHTIVNDVGNGVKSIVNPKHPAPTPTPPSNHPTGPSPTSKPPSTGPSNPGNGSGSHGGGNGDGSGSGSAPSGGNGGSTPSQPSAGNPAQSPTDGSPAPTQQPTSPTPPSDGQSTNPSNPAQNVGSDPNGSSPVPSLPNTNKDDQNSGDSLPSFTSFTTSDSVTYGISGSSTIQIPAGNIQSTSVTFDNGSSTNGEGGPSTPGHHKGFSTVAIGLITTAVVLIGLLSAVFIMRRVYQRRRADRRTRWAPVMAETGDSSNGPSRSSVRSSFATTFDYGLRAQSPVFPSEMPALPALPHIADPKRSSVESDHSQWLFVDRPQGQASGALLGTSGSPPLTPLSVAPFTPTEKYKFPQPPKSAQEPDDESPFSDYNGVSVKPPLTRGQTDNTEKSNYSQPSFSDKPTIVAGVSITVRRPFTPSLPDELYVTPGQVVTIDEMFDDGWNLVKTLDGTQGLVPLACFEEIDLPSGKRRSSLIDFN